MARKAKQETETAAATAPEPTTRKSPTWRIGLFKNDAGKLVTVYVGQDLKTPQRYETKRVGGREILIAREYSGIKYSEARQQLLKEAKESGIEAKSDTAIDSAPAPAHVAEDEKQSKQRTTPKKSAAKKTPAKRKSPK